MRRYIAAPKLERRSCKPLGSPGTCYPGNWILRYVPLRCHFLHFEITVNGKIVEFLTSSGSWGLLLPITSVHYRHYRAQSYCRLMLGSQKGKNGWETTEKQQTIVLKSLVKQRKHYLSLARKSFINRENIKRKREARNIRRKREVSGRNGRIGISVYIGSDRSNNSQSFSRPLRRELVINMAGRNFLDWCKKYSGVGWWWSEKYI